MLSQQISWLFDPIISSSLSLSLPLYLSLSLSFSLSLSLSLWVTEAAVTTAADAPESSNGQVSENRSGAALRQSSQPAPSYLGTSPTI